MFSQETKTSRNISKINSLGGIPRLIVLAIAVWFVTACATLQLITRSGELIGCWESIDREGGSLYLALLPVDGREDIYSFATNSLTSSYGSFEIKMSSHVTVIAKNDPTAGALNKENGDIVIIRDSRKVPIKFKVFKTLELTPDNDCPITWVEYRRISENPNECALLGGYDLKNVQR